MKQSNQYLLTSVMLWCVLLQAVSQVEAATGKVVVLLLRPFWVWDSEP
jgi:hypothetical protein